MNHQKVKLLAQLRTSFKAQQAYLEQLPLEFQELLTNNTYSIVGDASFSMLLEAVFAEDYEAAVWFLYEFEAGRSPGPHLIDTHGVSHTFATDLDYYCYLESL